MDKKTKKQKEKIKHRAINWKLVSEFCRGTAGHFILGTLGIVFAALSAYCIPLITSTMFSSAMPKKGTAAALRLPLGSNAL